MICVLKLLGKWMCHRIRRPGPKSSIEFKWYMYIYICSRWWFQIFFIFTPTWGNDLIWLNIFQMAWNHQLDVISAPSMIVSDIGKVFQKLHDKILVVWDSCCFVFFSEQQTYPNRGTFLKPWDTDELFWGRNLQWISFRSRTALGDMSLHWGGEVAVGFTKLEGERKSQYQVSIGYPPWN